MAVLAEIEDDFRRDDPSLHACLSRFRVPRQRSIARLVGWCSVSAAGLGVAIAGLSVSLSVSISGAAVMFGGALAAGEQVAHFLPNQGDPR
jgi:hypothetical protein